jgi:hypothetical protein
MVLGSVQTALAGGPAVSPEEFNLFREYVSARDDTRLEKYNDKAKVKKIARSLGVSGKQLQAAIDKVEPLIDSLQADSEKAIRAALDQTSLKKVILKVEVNLETEHAVAFVKWRCGDPRDHDKEAAYVAWAVSEGADVVKLLGLWCVNSIDTKLFSGKIARPALGRVNKSGIERFASSRYIRLFEDIKRGAHR